MPTFTTVLVDYGNKIDSKGTQRFWVQDNKTRYGGFGFCPKHFVDAVRSGKPVSFEWEQNGSFWNVKSAEGYPEYNDWEKEEKEGIQNDVNVSDVGEETMPEKTQGKLGTVETKADIGLLIEELLKPKMTVSLIDKRNLKPVTGLEFESREFFVSVTVPCKISEITKENINKLSSMVKASIDEQEKAVGLQIVGEPYGR